MGLRRQSKSRIGATIFPLSFLVSASLIRLGLRALSHLFQGVRPHAKMMARVYAEMVMKCAKYTPNAHFGGIG
jgi:hypothetical protein